jgi:Tol biopolymer transport system component
VLESAARHRITDADHGVGALAWSPDGSKIVFSDLTGEELPDRTIGGLFVVNRDGSGLRRITSGEDYWPCWPGAGNTIVFVRGHHIRAVNSDGTGGQRLVRNAACLSVAGLAPQRVDLLPQQSRRAQSPDQQ